MKPPNHGYGYCTWMVILCAIHATAAWSNGAGPKGQACLDVSEVTPLTRQSPETDSIKLRQRVLHALMDQRSPAPLHKYHLCLVDEQAFGVLAIELLSLTRGADWQQEPLSYLSMQSPAQGSTHYRHAERLGRWLGSLRHTLDRQDLDDARAADWLRSLEESSRVLMDNTPSQASVSDFGATGLISDVERGYLSLNEALELMTYGDVTASSVTIVIGQALRSVERKLH